MNPLWKRLSPSHAELLTCQVQVRLLTASKAQASGVFLEHAVVIVGQERPTELACISESDTAVVRLAAATLDVGYSALSALLALNDTYDWVSPKLCASLQTRDERICLVFSEEKACADWSAALTQLLICLRRLRKASSRVFTLDRLGVSEPIQVSENVVDLCCSPNSTAEMKEVCVTFASECGNTTATAPYEIGHGTVCENIDHFVQTLPVKPDVLNYQLIVGFLQQLELETQFKNDFGTHVVFSVESSAAMNYVTCMMHRKLVKDTTPRSAKLVLQKAVKLYEQDVSRGSVSDAFAVLFMQRKSLIHSFATLAAQATMQKSLTASSRLPHGRRSAKFFPNEFVRLSGNASRTEPDEFFPPPRRSYDPARQRPPARSGKIADRHCDCRIV